MGDLSNNLSRREFSCRCGCGFDTVDVELLGVVQDTSNHFDNRPLTITGPNRCPKRNEEEGGAEHSQHLFGKGVDFKIKGIHADKVADYLEKKYPKKYGMGRYKGRTHIDVRAKKARWDKR